MHMYLPGLVVIMSIFNSQKHTATYPLLLLGLRDELLVLGRELLDLLHELLLALVLHLLALSVHLALHVGHGFTHSLSFLFFHFRTQLKENQVNPQYVSSWLTKATDPRASPNAQSVPT